MQRRRALAFVNPANYYLLAGLILLGVSMYVPVFTGERTARLEDRAAKIAALLLEATLERPEGIGADDLENVLGRFYALAVRDEAFLGDLTIVEPPLEGTLLTLRSKHYAFHLAVSPPEVPSTRRDTLPAYEVVAWPLSAIGPAHSVFFVPDDAARAYTRNLSRGYYGLAERRPLPGHCHRRTGALFDDQHTYRSRDDERWITY
ncbi:MAG: hypothetical protein H6838_17130 [Planctomycetes bacterium]|nr:hypothetical protein [Planctomycetota bacterium]MCB9887217.1 hypothetical protein [Planctomycetota bacterium]